MPSVQTCPSSPSPRPSAPSLALLVHSRRTPPQALVTLHNYRLSASTPHVCTPPSLNTLRAQFPVDTSDLWRKIRYVVNLDSFHLAQPLLASTSPSLPVRLAYPSSPPTVSCSSPAFVTCAWVYNVESEHATHEDHLIEENNGTLPQPPAYPYLNRRIKPFPWGSNSLFFNPRVSFRVFICSKTRLRRTVQHGHEQGG